MKYLNLELALLRSDEFLGAEPLHRATWLALLARCADQENGGRMAGAGLWKDRRWQQLAGVTLEEVKATLAESELLTNAADDLVVFGYPSFQEAQVRASRANGAKGGRPPVENPGQNPGRTQAEPRPKRNGNGKGKGKSKGNRNSKDAPASGRPTTAPNVIAFSRIHPDDLDAYGPAPNSEIPEHPRWSEFAEDADGATRFADWLAIVHPAEAAELEPLAELVDQADTNEEVSNA